MNQTAYLFGCVAFAFLVFVTMRGDLAKWADILGV